MGLSGFFGRRNISALEVEIESPEEVYAKKTFLLTLRVTNRKRIMPGFLIRVRIEGAEVLFPYIENNSSAVKYLEVKAEDRGIYNIKSIFVSSVFPFNFFVRSRRLQGPLGIVVFPSPYPCETKGINAERDKRHKGDESSNRSGYEGDIISIRNYISGDPFKYINWKATAKTDALKTKELSAVTQEPMIIDLREMPYDIETALSCASYVINQLFNAKVPVGLRIGESFFEPTLLHSHRIMMLKELALYDKTP